MIRSFTLNVIHWSINQDTHLLPYSFSCSKLGLLVNIIVHSHTFSDQWRALTYSLREGLTHLMMYWLTFSFSLTDLPNQSLTHFLSHSLSLSLAPSFGHSFSHSLAHVLNQPLTDLLTHSLTNLFIKSLIQSIPVMSPSSCTFSKNYSQTHFSLFIHSLDHWWSESIVRSASRLRFHSFNSSSKHACFCVCFQILTHSFRTHIREHTAPLHLQTPLH